MAVESGKFAGGIVAPVAKGRSSRIPKAETRNPKEGRRPKSEQDQKSARFSLVRRVHGFKNGDCRVRRCVAQIFNLLYRRFAIGRCRQTRRWWQSRWGRQNAILRYSRLKICATPVKYPA